MAQNFIIEYINIMKSNDWTDGIIRRNPLYYGKIKHQFNWLDKASLEERKAWVQHQLELICRKALKTKYGRRHGGGTDISHWPFLSNVDVRSDPTFFLKPFSFISIPASTSGTSGVPLKLFRSPLSIVVEQISIDNFLLNNNCDLKKAKVANLKGDNIKSPSDMQPPFWKYTSSGNRLLLSSNHLNKDTIGYYFNVLNEYKPDCLIAYPTSLEALSDYLIQTGRRLYIPLVVASSEVLTYRARNVTEQALGCRIVEYYGQSERVAFAYSVRQNEYFFLPGYSYIELKYAFTDEYSDLYEIVGTPLWNFTMPLIRYQTGDLIQVPAGTKEQELERIRYGVDPFPEIVGRTDDWYLDSPEGVRLMGIPHIARDTEHVQQLQIIQESKEYVRFLVIPDTGFCEQDEMRILQNAALKLPESMRVSIELVDRPIRTRQGKTPFVIRRL